MCLPKYELSSDTLLLALFYLAEYLSLKRVLTLLSLPLSFLLLFLHSFSSSPRSYFNYRQGFHLASAYSLAACFLPYTVPPLFFTTLGTKASKLNLLLFLSLVEFIYQPRIEEYSTLWLNDLWLLFLLTLIVPEVASFAVSQYLFGLSWLPIYGYFRWLTTRVSSCLILALLLSNWYLKHCVTLTNSAETGVVIYHPGGWPHCPALPESLTTSDDRLTRAQFGQLLQYISSNELEIRLNAAGQLAFSDDESDAPFDPPINRQVPRWNLYNWLAYRWLRYTSLVSQWLGGKFLICNIGLHLHVSFNLLIPDAYCSERRGSAMSLQKKNFRSCFTANLWNLLIFTFWEQLFIIVRPQGEYIPMCICLHTLVLWL